MPNPVRAWFPLYAADWLSDRNVRLLTPAQRGAYVDLLCSSWLDGPLPPDLAALASLVGLPTDEFEAVIWPSLKPLFQETQAGLCNRRLEHEKRKAKKMFSDRSKGGKLTAQKRWGTKPKTRQRLSKGSSATAELQAQLPDSLLQSGRPHHHHHHHQNIPPLPPPSGGTEEEVFSRTWKEYPKRAGGNPRAGAFRKWRATVRSKRAEPADLHRATINYRRDQERRGKIGTEYVMGAERFYGPSEPWRDFLTEPQRQDPQPEKRYTCRSCDRSLHRTEMKTRDLCVSCDLKKARELAPAVKELIRDRFREPGKPTDDN